MSDFSIYIIPVIIVFALFVMKYFPSIWRNIGKKFVERDKELFKENYELRDALVETLKNKKDRKEG